MEAIQPVRWQTWLDPAELVQKSRRALDIAIHSKSLCVFAEMAVALVSSMTVEAFIAQPLSVALISTLLLVLALELGKEFVVHVFNGARGRVGAEKKTVFTDNVLHTARICSRESIVNLVATAGPSIAIHEAGHALAGLALYSGSKPSITISPWVGGATRLNMAAPFSYLGLALGRTVSISLVIAGGIIATTVTATLLMMAAFRLKDSHPNISQFLNLFACAQLINDIIYGLMSVPSSPANATSDFTRLHAISGIHPIATVAMMVAVPAIAQVAMRCSWAEGQK